MKQVKGCDSKFEVKYSITLGDFPQTKFTLIIIYHF